MVGKNVALAVLAILGAFALGAGLSALRDDRPSYTEAGAKRSVNGANFQALAAEKRDGAAFDFPFAAQDGQELTLAAFAGKVRVVNLWATWCAPCVVEMPGLMALEGTINHPDFKMIAVSIDNRGAPHVAKWLEKRQWDLEIFTAPSSQFGNVAIPTTWVLDREGRLAWIGMGAKDWESPEAIAMLNGLLAEP